MHTFFLVIVILLVPTFIACTDENDRRVARHTQEALDFFEGTHEVQNILERMSPDGIRVEFEWKANNGETYLVSSVPREKIRVQVNNNIQTPYVYFTLRCDPEMFHGFGGSCHNVYDFMKKDLQKVFEYYVTYITFVVRKEDWPPKIAMSFNNASVE